MGAMPNLRVRDSLPWLGSGVVVVLAFFGLAMATAGSPDESVGGFTAVLLWTVIVPAALLIVKGMLVFTEEMDSRQALVLAVLAIPLAVVAVILHNLVSAVAGFEEGFFFMVALFGAPLLFIAGVIRAFRPGGSGHNHTLTPSA